MTDILGVSEAVTLASVITAVQANNKVRFLPDADHSDEILVGTLRHICDRDFSMIGADTDVRDAFVRITLLTGMEYLMQVREATRLVQGGAMDLDYLD